MKWWRFFQGAWKWNPKSWSSCLEQPVPPAVFCISFPLASDYCRNVSLARRVSWTFHPSLIVTASLARNAKSSILFFSVHRKGCQFPGIFVFGCICHPSFAMLLPLDYWNVFIPNSNHAAMHLNVQSWWIFTFVIAEINSCSHFLGIFVVGCTCHLSFVMLLPSDYLNIFIPNNSNVAAMHCNLQDSVNCNLCDSMKFFQNFPVSWNLCVWLHLSPIFCHAIAFWLVGMYSSHTIANLLQCIVIFRVSESSSLWLHDIHPYLKWMNLYLRRNYVHWNFVHYCIRGYFRGGFIFANFASQTSRKFPL